MSRDSRKLTTPPSQGEVDAFLERVAASPRPRRDGRQGRLIFAMDATASREPTWDQAAGIQAEMFEETASLGGLAVQLCYYRGYRELAASGWVTRTAELQALMTRVRCAAGRTQIARVLRHALREHLGRPVDALVFVGDCMEESPDELAGLAGELGLAGVPAFLFQEGRDHVASQTFQRIAQLTHGAYCSFDSGSARQLRDLLSAVAVYASGGRDALEHFGTGRGAEVGRLRHQLKRGPG